MLTTIKLKIQLAKLNYYTKKETTAFHEGNYEKAIKFGKLVSGDVTPSGHLSDAHWYNHSDNPVSANFGGYTYNNIDNYDMPTVGNNPDNKLNT